MASLYPEELDWMQSRVGIWIDSFQNKPLIFVGFIILISAWHPLMLELRKKLLSILQYLSLENWEAHWAYLLDFLF